MNRQASFEQWGVLKPRGVDHLILLLSKMGFGRGRLKRFINKLWLSRNDKKPVDIEYHGLKMRLQPWDNTIEAKILFSSRLREGDELKQTAMHVDKRVFVDIGANAGYYSLMACKQGYQQVLAFEPNPLMYKRMMFNLRANGFENLVSVYQFALGGNDGEVDLAIAPSGDMGGTHVAKSRLSIGGLETITVPIRPLYEVLSEKKVTEIGTLKIDVEGFEDFVLFPFFKNAPQRIWPKLVIIEHSSSKDWSEDILSWMLENGYKLAARNKGNSMLVLANF